MKTAGVVFLLLLSGCLAASAATLGGLGMRDSLTESEGLSRLSVGLDYTQVKRTMSLDSGGTLDLDARIIAAQFGYDVLPWLTAFATAGRSEAKSEAESGYHDGEFKWSLGLKANWWHYDIEDPDFLEGRLSIQSTAEFAQFRSGSGNEEIKWNEGYADLTLNYEVFATRMKDIAQYPYSLVLYAGPAVSKINGSAGPADFSEDRLVGLVGGVDLYISHNLSLGGQIQHFDGNTLSASLRYHF